MDCCPSPAQTRVEVVEVGWGTSSSLERCFSNNRPAPAHPRWSDYGKSCEEEKDTSTLASSATSVLCIAGTLGGVWQAEQTPIVARYLPHPISSICCWGEAP